MKESFFGKQYDIPAGMNPKDFNEKLLNWKKTSEQQSDTSREKLETLDAAEMLLRTKDLIKGVSLKPEFSSKENSAELEKRKAVAVNLLNDLMDENGYIARYASSINRFNKANIFGDERDYEDFVRIDNERRLAHNALMDHIRMAIRYIYQQFSAMPVDEIDDLEETLEHSERKLLPIERIDFPAGNRQKIFLPGYANLDDRATITRWVEDIRNNLDAAKKRFNEN